MKFILKISGLKIKIIVILLMVFGIKLQSQNDSYPTNIIIDTVKCSENEEQSYALFLPKGYSKKKAYPIIILLDPMARGAFASKFFIEGAGKYGYIVAASNNSRNGPYENNYKAFDFLLNDVTERLSVDTNRIYISGFSGGSRAALAIAASNNKIAGVIGCGAGLPPKEQDWPTKQNDFYYVGMVGNRDMNYQEMFELKNKLNELEITNTLVIFNGIHYWPKSTELVKAFQMLQIEAIKKQKIDFNKKLVNEHKTTILEDDKWSLVFLDIIYTAFVYQNLIDVLGGLTDIEDIKLLNEELTNSKEYKSSFKKWEKTKEVELMLQKKYENAAKELIIPTANTDSLQNWWKLEIKRIQKMQRSADELKNEMASRLINMISTMSIEGTRNRLFNKDYFGARLLHNFRILINTNIQNPSIFYRLAQIEALDKQKDATLEAIEKSIELGLRSANLFDYNIFDFIRNEPEFIKLMETLE